MKVKLRWLSTALALSFLLSVLVPQVSNAAKPDSVVKGKGEIELNKGQPQMYFIPTSNPKKAEKIRKQLQQGKSPEELGLISTQHAKRKPTLTQMEEEVSIEKDKRTYPVKMPVQTAADAWNPPPFEYDDIQFDECIENRQSSEGWIKNHYSYCWSNYVVYSDPAGCGPSPFPFFCDWVSFRLTVIGNGYNGMRTVSFRYKVDDIKSDLDSPNWRNGSRVSVSIQCDGVSEIRDCIGDESPDTRTLAKWRKHSEGSTFFDSDPPPITGGNKDQVSYMDFWPRVTVDPPGTKYPPLTSDGPKEKVRADSADYLFVFPPGGQPPFWPKEGAIFANVTPTFYYDVNDPYFSVMKEAFQHHKDALTAPGSIVPGLRPKPPLTRLYSKYDPEQYAANTRAKDQACAKLTKPGDDYECDEFPFASTYEGAASGAGKFSVRYIPRSANNSHGRWLAAWYAYDRILHKDPFYIGFRE